MVRIAIVFPSPALRAGLKSLLASDEEISIVGEAGDLDHAMDEINEADVVITSASYASFLDDEAAAASSASILFLSNDPLDVREVMRSHSILGVVPLEASAPELRAAIHALAQGLTVGERSLFLLSKEENFEQSPLTDRETEVLTLLSKGLANKQIAAALGISEHTVKFHVSSIYAKLNVTNRTEAMRAGLRGGWIAL